MSDYDRDTTRSTTTRTTTTEGADRVYVSDNDRRGADRDKGGGLGRTLLILLILAVLAAIAAYALGLFDVDAEGELRTPQVEIKGGEVPSFDVDAADVDVGTTNTQVEVPTIETEKTNIEVPTITVDKADKE